MSYVDVEWIPGSADRLITWGSNIRLYRVLEGPELSLELEGEIPQPPHYMKCLCPLSATNGEARAVAGGANGRISLLSFDSVGGAVKEFGKPASSRAVLGLAWNGNSLLAAGFEKTRNGPAVQIFDASPFLASQHHPLGQDHVRSPLGIENGETCSSLSWTSTCGSETLVYGSSGKYLRLVDIRQGSSRFARVSTSTRAVFGVTVDPFLDCRIASHVDNQVVIWDTRNFDKPIITHSQNRKISKISWSPTRMGLLCSITEHAESLLLHDIQSWAIMMEDGEPAVTERRIALQPSVDPYTSFLWHPNSENTLISTTSKGALKKNIVPERISPSWSSRHSLCWPTGGVLRIYDATSELFSEIQDISQLMQERASRGYGPKLSENIRISTTDPHLCSAWKWMRNTIGLIANDKELRSEWPSRSPPGVRPALQRGEGSTPAEQRPWFGISSLNPRDFYRSPRREKAMKIAGWFSGAGYDNVDLHRFIESLEKKGEYSRAAAIALFSLDLRLALNVLQRGASQFDDKERANSMHMVSMALSGYTEDKSGLWHEMVPGSNNTLHGDPYLQILFTFLMVPDDNYSAILDSELHLGDRVAFACGYLSDAALEEYIQCNWLQLTEEGNLLGLILCGMRNNESVDLLQRYLDITGDIQSVSWMTSKGLHSELILNHPRPQVWINCFRNLLNMWNLWSVRAEFDISVNEILKKPLQQVYVSCNFCGRCIGQHVKTGMPKVPSVASKQSQQQPFKSNGWLQACPSCRKPLPRCSVCLINMGTMSGLNIQAATPQRGTSKKISPFKNFFSWCQTCRHGGHALHILDWFKDHGECPVSGCSCKCSNLDGGLLSSNKDLENEL